MRLSDIRGEICGDDALLGYVKKRGRGKKVMDRCARLEVRIERKWKLRTGFISG